VFAITFENILEDYKNDNICFTSYSHNKKWVYLVFIPEWKLLFIITSFYKYTFSKITKYLPNIHNNNISTYINRVNMIFKNAILS